MDYFTQIELQENLFATEVFSDYDAPDLLGDQRDEELKQFDFLMKPSKDFNNEANKQSTSAKTYVVAEESNQSLKKWMELDSPKETRYSTQTTAEPSIAKLNIQTTQDLENSKFWILKSLAFKNCIF